MFVTLFLCTFTFFLVETFVNYFHEMIEISFFIDLDLVLRQVCVRCQPLPQSDIWIRSHRKDLLQLGQLCSAEDGSLPLPLGLWASVCRLWREDFNITKTPPKGITTLPSYHYITCWCTVIFRWYYIYLHDMFVFIKLLSYNFSFIYKFWNIWNILKWHFESIYKYKYL